MNKLIDSINQAESVNKILSSAKKNILTILETKQEEYVVATITELVERSAWDELNNRFFQHLVFGTGGLRGKTIGDIITEAEKGKMRLDGRPEKACVGTNAMNSWNVDRCIRGLFAYIENEYIKSNQRPVFCVSYDTRFFSKDFAELAANLITKLGGDVYLFSEPRSTPELSFAIRYYNATAGINFTASHNPFNYNGLKVYFDDGAQIVDPIAIGVIKYIRDISCVFSNNSSALNKKGVVKLLGKEIDEAYIKKLESTVLNRSIFNQKNLKIIYTPLHGVGGSIIVPLCYRLGIDCFPVPSQIIPDGLFPTVHLPNPEYPDAFKIGIEIAEQYKADIVQATDPDADRMGVAVRDSSRKFVFLNGNQIGCLLLWYRLMKLFELGILNRENASRAVVIKSLVTSDLQKAIALKFGVRCVETLTGFKYICAKMKKYEISLPEDIRLKYRQLSVEESRVAQLEFSSFVVFGGEESYGYTVADFVRDKDSHSAVIGFAEVFAYAVSQGLNIISLLDNIYTEYGFYLEKTESLIFEGASGFEKMNHLMSSYNVNSPEFIDGKKVISVKNYFTEKHSDSEGELLPSENMIILQVEDINKIKIIIRPSGTEPKIKYYLYAHRSSNQQPLPTEQLATIKIEVALFLDNFWHAIKKDAEQRISAITI